MNLHEHTIVARQDTTQNQINQLKEKYSKIIDIIATYFLFLMN